MLRIRTSHGMIELAGEEAGQLRERLRRVPSAQPAEATIAVSANASTSVKFTRTEELAVLDVLTQWIEEVGVEGMGEGPSKLRKALFDDLHREQ
jgi:hypothetical protein